jgi:hypothetical protein
VKRFEAMIKHLMGVIGVVLAVLGIGFFHTAFFTTYGLWWDQGAMGVLCWFAALGIYLHWFR